MAAVRTGDTLVVTKLDRLARSLPDARDIAQELTDRGVRLQIGSTIHDPADPAGRLLFNVLAMLAEFEADLISARAREGLLVAKAKGRLKGKPPKLTLTRRRTSSRWSRPASTRERRSPSASESRAPPCTAHVSARREARWRTGDPGTPGGRGTSTSVPEVAPRARED